MATYVPKGGMCTTCEKCLNDCSKLPFKDMPVIERGSWAYTVKCTEYKKDFKKPIKTGE